MSQLSLPNPGTLLLRRKEIYQVIRDHKIVSFDYIRRNFISTPERTLHYDLQQLAKKGFIKKLGVTRGALYSPINFKLAS